MQISCIYNGKKLLLSQFLCSLTHVHTLSQRPFLACTLQYVKNEMTTYEMYFNATKLVINIIILLYFRAEYRKYVLVLDVLCKIGIKYHKL